MATNHSSRRDALTRYLQTARKQAGLSQRDLSLQLGRDRGFIHRVEIGEREVGFVEAIEIAEALQRDPFDMLEFVLGHGRQQTEITSFVVTAAPLRDGAGKAKQRR